MFKDLLQARRAYRALLPAPVPRSHQLIMAQAASLAPSCFNHQPWKFLFISGEHSLSLWQEALTDGNYWAKRASLAVVVYTDDEWDCVIKKRRYASFDTGMAAFSLILTATELGYVAHPIAGFSPSKIAKQFHIDPQPDFMACIVIGKKTEDLSVLEERHHKEEKERPPRKDFDEFVRFFEE